MPLKVLFVVKKKKPTAVRSLRAIIAKRSLATVNELKNHHFLRNSLTVVVYTKFRGSVNSQH